MLHYPKYRARFAEKPFKLKRTENPEERVQWRVEAMKLTKDQRAILCCRAHCIVQRLEIENWLSELQLT